MKLNDYLDERFENELRGTIETLFPLGYATEVLYYTLNSGKNRFRSVLPLLTAEITGSNIEKAKIIGSVAEIAWTGIIIHDDIIDNDTQRRGKAAAHIQFSQNSALCSAVIGLVDGSVALKHGKLSNEIEPYNTALSRTYHGQVLHQRISKDSTIEELFDVYALKTSLGVWAISAGVEDEKLKDALIRFSKNLGEAGQIKDDLDDLFADGNYEINMRDLREGIYNLPLVLFYQRASKEDVSFINQFFGNRGNTAPKSDVIARLRYYNVINQCIEYSQERIGDAIKNLDLLPKHQSKDILIEWANSHSVKGYIKK